MFNPRISELLKEKEVFVFELVDVLFPKRDFLLQVYYMFAQFMEYAEGRPISGEMTAFMAKIYDREGETGIFEKTANQFALDGQHQEAFERLHHKVQLPVKLIVYPEMMEFMQRAHSEQKKLLILTAGDPLKQLNLIKQTEWEGLGSVLQVYFDDELRFAGHEPYVFIAQELDREVADFCFVGVEGSQGWTNATTAGVNCVQKEDFKKLP